MSTYCCVVAKSLRFPAWHSASKFCARQPSGRVATALPPRLVSCDQRRSDLVINANLCGRQPGVVASTVLTSEWRQWAARRQRRPKVWCLLIDGWGQRADRRTGRRGEPGPHRVQGTEWEMAWPGRTDQGVALTVSPANGLSGEWHTNVGYGDDRPDNYKGDQHHQHLPQCEWLDLVSSKNSS